MPIESSVFSLPPDTRARMDMLARQQAQGTVDRPQTPAVGCEHGEPGQTSGRRTPGQADAEICEDVMTGPGGS
jgi:hypothetical protein